MFTQRYIQAQLKENIKAPRHWPLCVEFTGDRWFHRTKGQWRGKGFHLLTSSWTQETSNSVWLLLCNRKPSRISTIASDYVTMDTWLFVAFDVLFYDFISDPILYRRHHIMPNVTASQCIGPQITCHSRPRVLNFRHNFKCSISLSTLFTFPVYDMMIVTCSEFDHILKLFATTLLKGTRRSFCFRIDSYIYSCVNLDV